LKVRFLPRSPHPFFHLMGYLLLSLLRLAGFVSLRDH
jgi:hypothetical protein